MTVEEGTAGMGSQIASREKGLGIGMRYPFAFSASLVVLLFLCCIFRLLSCHSVLKKRFKNIQRETGERVHAALV
jgi:hypothetical protein